MGGQVSQAFQSGSALLTNGHGHKVSDSTRQKVQTIFDALRANPRIGVQRLEGLLQQIPKNENILSIHDEAGYNLLQKCVGANNVELVRWLLARHSAADVNRFPCSLPLHIACLKGHDECVELLVKHGAKSDVEARMCWPGPHSSNCEERGKYSSVIQQEETCIERDSRERIPSSKLQSAIYYALDGDQVNILTLLAQRGEDPWNGIFRARKPLLHSACERGAWKCTEFLIKERSDEIHVIKDEYYPIHYAVLHDSKFLELLIDQGADTTVRTCTQQMTLLHVVLLVAHKTAEDTISTIRLLLEHGCKELINTPDSLGNTPLHALIVRYALEEAQYGYDKWNKWDVLHLVRYLIQCGARQSINHTGNSAVACVLRHVRDWDVCYELLNMLLNEGGDPNMVGRDGSVPLMVCLVPLINKDPLHHFTHSMKVCYLNCIRILLKNGANPNCSYRANLTPLHVLVFTVSENITLNCDIQKELNFEFIKNLLILLLTHGLDPNERRLQRYSLRLRSDTHSDTIWCEPGLNFEYVRSDKEPPVAFAEHLEKEKLHHVLLHYVDFEEGKRYNGPQLELFQDHHIVLLRHATQAAIRMPQDIAYTAVEFGTWENDRAPDVHHQGFVQKAEESETNVPSQDTQLSRAKARLVYQ
ncbi:hypothetical protein JTB14_037614 [Gonioctena quinquepunctata]|nr:hypothetical protein JTB14_037614 [Gonioctena quinquepunctata]